MARRASWARAPRRSARTFAAVTLCVALVAGPLATGGRAQTPRIPRCADKGQITPHPIPPQLEGLEVPTWYSIRVPAFPRGSGIIADLAVDTLAPQNLYVTNGSVVLRSADAGCSWETTYELPATDPEARILEVEASSPGVAYLSIQREIPVPGPRVMVTTNAGATWSDASGAVLSATAGRVRDLDAALADTGVAVLVDVEHSESGVASFEGIQALFVRPAGAAEWEPRHVRQEDARVSAGPIGGQLIGFEGVEKMEVNPANGDEIWLYGPGGVFRSGGGNLAEVPLDGVTLIDIALDGGILAFNRAALTAYVSRDGGASFASFATGLAVDSADSATVDPFLASGVSTLGSVYFLGGNPGQIVQDISPLDGRPVSDVHLGVTPPTAALYGHTPNTIEVTYTPEEQPRDPSVVQASLRPPPPPGGINGISPRSKRLVLGPGVKRTVPYTLSLPAASTPLDVYFMIDISGSMGGTIDGIRSAMQEIANQLADLELDVRFGVGSFRSYDDPPAYDRVRNIGPADQSLADALNSLRATGGGRETQMAALLQSATGTGDSIIPPGLNMDFRPNSLRVAIEVTDEPISQGSPHPTFDEVIAGLRQYDVKQVALAIQESPTLGEHDYENPGVPARDLQTVASGTGAVAPPGGVDCDGNGDIEIDPGEPIVCMVSPDRSDDAALMADAIVSVLKAIQDIRDLDVTVGPAATASAESPVVERVTPSVLPGVDLKQDTGHVFDVTVRCPRREFRTIHPLQIAVRTTDRVLADATLTLICRPVPPEERVPPLAAFVPVALIPPPPLRPPDPVPEPNPNPQPNPQQNPQAQAGFAAQEQQQPQVALAQQQALPGDHEVAIQEHRMSARDERIPPVGFIFAAGAITSVYALATLTRERVRVAPAGRRRGRRRR